MVLVLPAGLLLVHEPASWRLVLLTVCVVIELTHDFVELVHVEIITHATHRLVSRLFVEKGLELSLDKCDLVLEILVMEHVSVRTKFGRAGVDACAYVGTHG